jgi:Ca-activated chloride channel family protein
MLRFHDPWWFLLLLTLPLIIARHLRANAGATLRYSSVAPLQRLRASSSVHVRRGLVVLRCVAVALLAIALARPQRGNEDTRVSSEGIDIVLALDTSGSMIAEDLAQGKNRLDVVKEVTRDFVRKRKDDRIGLVVYGEDAFTQCPLTLNAGVLLQFVDRCHIGMAGENRTAIGDALSTAVARLRNATGKSRVVILLTDGQNNSGRISPETAAEIARTLGVKVYTIGAGTRGMAPVPARDPFGNKVYVRQPVDIDENLLQSIATVTSGQYFRATDNKSLQQIYSAIDKMERTNVEVFNYMEWKELFSTFALCGAGFLIFDVVLMNTRFRKLP